MNSEHRIESQPSQSFGRLLFFSLVLIMAAALTALPFN